RYASTSEGNGDWGSTLVALRTRTALSLDVDQEIVADARRQLLALPRSLDMPTAVTVVVPLLGIVGLLGPGDKSTAEKARAVAAQVDTLLQSVPMGGVDVSWLTTADELQSAKRALGLPGTKIGDTRCRSFVGSNGYASLPGSSTPNTQLT